MSSEIPASACSSLRSGLCIDIPTPDSSPEGSAAFPTSPANITRSLSSGTRPEILRETSESGSHPTKIHRPSRPIPQSLLSLRSSTGMQGLLLAEIGGGLVQLDPLGGGSGFKQGTTVMPGLVTPRGGASGAVHLQVPPVRHPKLQGETRLKIFGGSQRLSRQATLLSQGVTPSRNAAELKSLLGNSRSKVKSRAKLLPPPDLPRGTASTDLVSTIVSLEQGKSRARVEVDILLNSDTCVEGGYFTGKLHVKIRNGRAPKEALMLMGGGKMRVVGFEGIPDNKDKNMFYQHVVPLFTISSSTHVLYSSSPDEEGFSHTREGQHIVPFAMKLPISEGVHVGAKGAFDDCSGAVVKYIIIASFELKDPATSKRSIAHFYRGCEIYPYFNSSVILAPAIQPLLSTAARGVFLGGPGKLKLTASLHRNIWIAGQKCCIGIAVDNESKKSVKGLMLSLIRTTTIFRPHPHLDVASPSSADQDACQTTTTQKLVTETILEAGQRGLRGHVTEKGWWIGVGPGTQINFTHFILLPHDTLSIVRSRLLEVNYAIRVSLIAGSLSSEVSVMLPLRIINHLSIDPPPSYPIPFHCPGVSAPVPPLPISAPNSHSKLPFSNSPVLPCSGSIHGIQNRALPNLGPLASMFDEVSAREHIHASDAAALAPGILDEFPLLRKSYFLPKLDEEDSDIEEFGYSSDLSGIDNFLDNNLSQDNKQLCATQEADDDEHFSDDSGANDATQELPIDDSALDLLGNLNVYDSDEEVDVLVGSAGLEDQDEPKLKRITDFHHEPEATVSAKASSHLNESHPEGSSLKLPRLGPRAPREKLTAVAHPLNRPCRTLEPHACSLISSVSVLEQTLNRSTFASQFTPDYGSSEVSKTSNKDEPFTSHHSGQSSDGSWQGETLFSQRVDRLVAARLSAAENAGVKRLEMSSTEPRPKFSGRQVCPLPASLSICRPSERTPQPSEFVTSERTAMAASLSGSVRSRIAELEGRATATR